MVLITATWVEAAPVAGSVTVVLITARVPSTLISVETPMGTPVSVMVVPIWVPVVVLMTTTWLAVIVPVAGSVTVVLIMARVPSGLNGRDDSSPVRTRGVPIWVPVAVSIVLTRVGAPAAVVTTRARVPLELNTGEP